MLSKQRHCIMMFNYLKMAFSPGSEAVWGTSQCKQGPSAGNMQGAFP